VVGPVSPGEQLLLPGFRVRDVRETDRAAILAMTANTWAFGDYIEWVFDTWLADRQGRFIAAEQVETGRLAAIDKITFISPEEAWFEGLRVAPEFRGLGLASHLQTYMINEVRRAGAYAIRLLTSISNKPVQRVAYRDGFVLKSIVSFWKWTAADATSPIPAKQMLRNASADEAGTLFDWWLRSSAYRTGGLCHRNWSYSETGPAEWSRAAVDGRLFVMGEENGDWFLPPASVIITSEEKNDGAKLWIVAAVCAQGTEWTPLMTGLLRQARAQGVGEINGLFARDPEAEAALQAVGFSPDEDDEPLCLFELRL